MWRPQRILVGTDFSETARAALRVAMNLARRTGAHPGEMRARVMERLRELAKEVGPPEPKLIVLFGDPATELSALRDLLGADLVVLGAVRHVDGIPGRVTDRVARAGLPALMVV